jgi:hypothetical protein
MEEFTARSLAQLLGIYPSSVGDWIRDGKLSSQDLGNRHIISRQDVIDMATKHPHHFHRVPDAALKVLFDNDLVVLVKSTSPRSERIKKITKFKCVKFLPTGAEYESVTEAAIAHQCSESGIRYHLNNKTSRLWKHIK